MPQDTAHAAALDRIAAALDRIEAVVAARAERDAVPAIAEAYALLDERHTLLRLRIQETIERLDRMIAAEEPA